MAVLTYAVQSLGVEHIVVVGHSSCGGIAAGLNLAKQAVQSGPRSPSADDHSGPAMLLNHLQPLQELAEAQLEGGSKLFSGGTQVSPAIEKLRLRELVRLHALQQAKNISDTDVVKHAKGPLTVDAWVRPLVTLLEMHVADIYLLCL